MKIEHLKYLLVAIHYGSMNKASNALFCTQPTITNAIKSIENELGYAVVKRSANGIIPTELGRYVVEDAKLIISYFERWKENFGITGGTVNVVFSGIISHYRILDAIFRLKETNPEIQVSMYYNPRHGDSRNIMDFMHDKYGRIFRLGLCQLTPEDAIIVKKIVLKHGMQIALLKKGEFCVFSQSKCDFMQKDTLELKDIEGMKIAFFREPSEFPYISKLDSVNCKYSILGNNESIMLAVALGQAVAIRPAALAENNYYTELGMIKYKSFSDCPMPVHLYIIFPNDARLTTPERLFIEALKNNFNRSST